MIIKQYADITDRYMMMEIIRELNKEETNSIYISSETIETALTLAKYMYIDYRCKPTLSTETNNTIIISFENEKKNLLIKVTGYFVLTELIDKETNNVVSTAVDSKERMYETISIIKLFYNSKMDKVCLFTGSFNPPTVAHFHMIDFVMDAGEFDYIVFAAANTKFLEKKQKKTGGKAFSENARLNMLLAMTKDHPNVIVYGPEEGYTYDMLCTVKEKYNPKDLYFVLGSDKLTEIERWGHHDKLLSEFCFYIHQRDDSMEYIKNECDRIFARTKYVVGRDDGQYGGISATMVREMMEKEEDYSEFVPLSVYDELENMKDNGGWDWR